MKKKTFISNIIFFSIILSVILVLILLYFYKSSKSFYAAKRIMKTSDAQKHKKALEELKNINNILSPYFHNPYLSIGEKYKIEILKDYQVTKKNELIQKYEDTFISFTGSDFYLYVMSFDGKKIKQLTNDYNALFSEQSKWSPDGKTIAFYGTKDAHNIFIVNNNGTGLQQITNSVGNENPDWSPDGKKIVYNHGSDIEVYDFDENISKKIYQWKYYGEYIDGEYPAFFPIWIDNENIMVTMENALQIINYKTKEIKKSPIEEDIEMKNLFISNYNSAFEEKKLSNNGKMVALTNGNFILHLDDYSKSHTGLYDEYPTWSPDDKYIMHHVYGVTSMKDGIYVAVLDENERLENIDI